MQVEIHTNLHACCFVAPYWTAVSSTAYLAAMEIMCACRLRGPPGGQKRDIHLTSRGRDCNEPYKHMPPMLCHGFTPTSQLPSPTVLGNHYNLKKGRDKLHSLNFFSLDDGEKECSGYTLFPHLITNGIKQWGVYFANSTVLIWKGKECSSLSPSVTTNCSSLP